MPSYDPDDLLKTVIISVVSVLRHAMNYRVRHEQRQIIVSIHV